MGNMFADYFKQIARYNSERKGWYVYDGSVWRPDKGNLKVSELAKLLADKLYVFALTITEEDAGSGSSTVSENCSCVRIGKQC